MSGVTRAWIRIVLAMAMLAGGASQAMAQRVALLAADAPELAEDVRAKLQSAGLTDITVINVAALDETVPPTPTLADLLQYDAILTWSDEVYADPGGLGDVLADYVDSGRGIVQAVFSFHTSTALRPDGRWRTDAYEPFSFSGIRRVAGLSLVPALPGHPILEGVASFEGGASGLHHSVSTRGCADIVARWSNGQPLVAVRRGPRGGRVVGLNFFPPSSDAGAGFWNAATDGHLLLANAVRFASVRTAAPAGPAVAVMASDEDAWVTDVRCKLLALDMFSRVDALDVRFATPASADLAAYDAVLTWSNYDYSNAPALGDLLAGHVDAGRGVVQAGLAFDGTGGRQPAGRWLSAGYRPFTTGAVTAGAPLVLVPDISSHALLAGVSGVSGGPSSFHSSPIALDAATTLVASWSNGQPLAAVGSGPVAGRIVGLNLYPPSSNARADFWDSNTDGARLIGNALVFAANLNSPPTADAGPDLAAEATSPAGATFAVTGAGADPDGDALSFAWSGAGSASGASITVDVPLAASQPSHTVTLTLTVSDGNGGEATDMVNLTVRDTQPPVLAGVPASPITATATGPDGAAVAYGPITAMDAADGPTPVQCTPAGPQFPVGETTVTCTATDSRGYTASASFVVRVSAPAASSSGFAIGHGLLRVDASIYQFAFDAIARRAGAPRATFVLHVKTPRGGRARPRVDQFMSRTTEAVSLDYTASSVQLSGTGSWNGTRGYRYSIMASRNAVQLVITAPSGATVVDVGGELTRGQVRVGRLP